MKENQRIEWKEAWRDEFLRWICGFANAEGGVLHIGRNDKGVVVGVPNAARLLEEIPNKVRDILGIIVEVNLRDGGGKEYLEIVVEPYPYPVSYKGEYHLRSGSTKQELKGAALDKFLLRKQGRTWDAVPAPRAKARDLSKTAIATFRKLARQSLRADASVLRESTAGLLEKLNLMDGAHLKRAAVLLFHPEPERLVTGAFIKIGFFRNEADLLYHDEVHGDLFSQSQKAMELLVTKYLKAAISYRGIHRVESLPVPEDALREALLNAIIHRDYAVGAPIQIRVYEDRLKIWNPAELPARWTARKLLAAHPSQPFNPNIAGVFFRAGEIEAWGRGIQRIVAACETAGVPAPVITYHPGDLWVEFRFSSAYVKAVAGARPVAETGEKAPVETPVETRVKTPVKTPERIMETLKAAPEMTLSEVAAVIGKSVSAVERAGAKLVKAGRLRHRGPRKGGRWEVLP